jgi:hypothetical protein
MKKYTVAGIACVGTLISLFLIDSTAFAAGTPLVAPADACINGKVDQLNLVTYLLTDFNDQKLDPRDALTDLADSKLRMQHERDDPNLLGIEQETQNMLNKLYDQYYPTNGGSPTYQDYFQKPESGANQVTISCKTTSASGNLPPSQSPDGLRIRGTPDDLIYLKSDQGFTGASKATINFSDNGTSKTRTDQLQAAIGYAISLDSGAGAATRYIVVPYIATNRNVSNVTGKPTKYNVETVDFGVAGSALDIPSGGWILSLTPDYLLNLQDDSNLASLHPIATPHIVYALNDPWNLGDALHICTAQNYKPCGTSWPYVMILGDVRSDLGIYTDRGNATDYAANQNFARLGSKFGLDVSLKNWYELAITHTYLYGFTGSRKNLNDFESSLSYYFGNQNVLALTVSYKNGLLEQSAIREQSWTAGITAKY